MQVPAFIDRTARWFFLMSMETRTGGAVHIVPVYSAALLVEVVHAAADQFLEFGGVRVSAGVESEVEGGLIG